MVSIKFFFIIVKTVRGFQRIIKLSYKKKRNDSLIKSFYYT